MKGNKELIQYVRYGDRCKKGVFVSFAIGDCVAIGYALCSNYDEWDIVDGKRIKGFGLELARQRAVKNFYKENINIPVSIQKDFNKFINRSERYFKEKLIPYWVVKS